LWAGSPAARGKITVNCIPKGVNYYVIFIIQSDTKKLELLKNPTKIEEIQEKKLLTEIEPLQFAF